jgi:hypothetical protein
LESVSDAALSLANCVANASPLATVVIVGSLATSIATTATEAAKVRTFERSVGGHDCESSLCSKAWQAATNGSTKLVVSDVGALDAYHVEKAVA